MVAPLLDEIWLVALDPTEGHQIQKTRPCLVVSPNEMNGGLQTVLVAPLTSTIRPYATRVGLTFQSKKGQVVADQIRAVDRRRLIRRLGHASATTVRAVSALLVEMFTRVDP